MAAVSGQSVERYLEKYVESYMAACEAKKGPVSRPPPFCKGYPFHVRAYILPNEAVVATFQYNAPSARIEVMEAPFESVTAVLQTRQHHAMVACSPMKGYTDEDARRDAAQDLARDQRLFDYRNGLESAFTSIVETEALVTDIAKTNPWLERQLLGVADKLGKTAEPMEKLKEEFKRMEGEGRYQDDELRLVDLQKYRQSPDVPLAALTEPVVEKYIKAYIEAYRSTIKPDYPEAARPAFYKGHPFHVRAFILPNESVAVTFKYAVPSFKLEVSRASPDLVSDLLKGKEHSNFLVLPPLKSMRREDAAYDAKLAVKSDMHNALLRALLASARSGIGEEEKNILDIAKTNPWLEKQLAQAAARLSGVKQLLVTLNDELEKAESGKRAGDHEQLLDQLTRHRSPLDSGQPEEEVVTMDSGQPAWTQPGAQVRPAQPVYAEQSASYVEQATIQKAEYAPRQAAPQAVRYELAAEEKQALDMIKATLYNIDVKMDDFERRLNYMDKYVEAVQKQQAEKFNAQNEIVRYEARSAKYAGIGIASTSLVLMMLFILDWWLHIFDPIRSLLGL
jgi:archaellum component FlaC